SKEFAKMAEWSGYAGYEFRGKPDGFDAPTGAFRWGTGVGFPSRNVVRLTAELNGFVPSSDSIVETTATLVGDDRSIAPILSQTENLTRATVGVTIQARSGFFVGGGVSWNVPQRARDTRFTDDDQFGDYFDWQVRIGFHPGVRVYVPPPPPPPPPPPTP